MVRASNHALLARSSSTTASVSHSQRRREEVLMRSRRIKTVASDPSPNELGVNRCPHETRGNGRREEKGGRALPEQAPAGKSGSNLPRFRKAARFLNKTSQHYPFAATPAVPSDSISSRASLQRSQTVG